MKTFCIVVLVLIMAVAISGIVVTWFTDFYIERPNENGEIVAVFLPTWVQNIVKTVVTVVFIVPIIYVAVEIHTIATLEYIKD